MILLEYEVAAIMYVFINIERCDSKSAKTAHHREILIWELHVFFLFVWIKQFTTPLNDNFVWFALKIFFYHENFLNNVVIILIGLVWFGLILWRIKHHKLFNAKSFLYMYIKCMISKHIS